MEKALVGNPLFQAFDEIPQFPVFQVRLFPGPFRDFKFIQDVFHHGGLDQQRQVFGGGQESIREPSDI